MQNGHSESHSHLTPRRGKAHMLDECNMRAILRLALAWPLC